MMLPEPANWRSRRGLTVVAVLSALGFAGFCAFWSVLMVSRQHLLTAAFVAACAIGFGLLALVAMRVRLLGQVTPRGFHTTQGTTVRSDALVEAMGAAACAALFVAGVLFVIYAPQRRLDISLTDGQRIFLPIGVLLVLGLLIGHYVVWRRYGTPRIQLNTTGLLFHAGLRPVEIHWGEIREIADQTPSGRSENGQPIVVHRIDAQPYVFDKAGGFTPNGAALYWMLRYCWLHPERRGELADGRALSRYLAGDFPAD